MRLSDRVRSRLYYPSPSFDSEGETVGGNQPSVSSRLGIEGRIRRLPLARTKAPMLRCLPTRMDIAD